MSQGDLKQARWGLICIAKKIERAKLPWLTPFCGQSQYREHDNGKQC